MDLIYADDTRKDIGVLQAYELDMAYGADENDFRCSVDRNDHCCSDGYYIYVEGEEYGGIVDSIRVNTESDQIQYKGRTWHGILERKVICPDLGNDYLILHGEANTVLQEIIDRIGLSSLFIASSEDSDIQIVSYQMDRYCYAYSGIRKMLKAFFAKLKLSWTNGMIVMSAVPVDDYSQDEEFDTSQVDFTLQKNFRPVNHMVCLGQGDLKERAVIHLFTDENGGVQTYLRPGVTDPLQDSDYITDISKQVLFDENEVVEAYDVPNAEITKNYIIQTSKPADWDSNCESYFYYEPKLETIDNVEVDTGGSYKSVELVDLGYILLKKQPYDWTEAFDSYYYYDSSTGKYKNVSGTVAYQLLSSKPGNWNEGYGEYYYNDSGTYKSVPSVTTTTYVKQSARPSDWSTNYGNYYILYNDGVQTSYQQVSGVTYYEYKLQTSKPSDWSTNYGSYYRKATASELKKNKNKKWYSVEKTKKNKVPTWKKNTYYTRYSKEKAPNWSDAVRYTKVDTTGPPAWAANTYYYKNSNAAPAYSAGTYYEETDKKIAPAWVSGKYFYQVLDRFAVMVAAAIEKLAEYHASDELGIDLEETEQTYDVGDIVGTIENVTGLETVQEVLKKIIKIQNDDITLTYEVG